jgi:hypothetical protein
MVMMMANVINRSIAGAGDEEEEQGAGNAQAREGQGGGAARRAAGAAGGGGESAGHHRGGEGEAHKQAPDKTINCDDTHTTNNCNCPDKTIN